jgi:starch synthase
MNVLFASTEAAPFAKVGGMADVVGSLPAALRRKGVDARVILPFYGFINPEKYNVELAFDFWFPRKTGAVHTYVYRATVDGVPFYLVRGWPYFGDEASTYTDWGWDVPRFLYFSQVTLAVAWELRGREGWFPDVFQVNDWHTGLIPFLLSVSRGDPNWAGVGSVLSIHNMAYQGEYVGGWTYQLGIPVRNQPDLVYQDKTDNLMGIAIAYSDMVTTVSPRYAIEIQYPYMGYGLDGLIRTRLPDLYGILNGLDVDLWNPATDPLLLSNFDAENFGTLRPPNKAQLQRDAGLPVRADVPIIGVVSRLVSQKGFDLAIPALRQLLSENDVQVVVLGSGEPNLEYDFSRLGADFVGKARVFHGYNALIAQRIYAGSDVFLMPSHFEPCGIGQMIAMRYGSLPLVRETGGLADTVENYDNGPAERGTGFVFGWQQPNAVLNTLRWAVDVFRERPDAWRRMQQRAMQRDFSWDSSASAYIEVYRKAIIRRRGAYTE